MNDTPTPPTGDKRPEADFKVGDYIQEIGEPDGTVFRVDNIVGQAAAPLFNEGTWFYSVTVMTGPTTGNEFLSVIVSPDKYTKVPDPDTWPLPGSNPFNLSPQAIVERVLNLWDSEGGWIPGAAREKLAVALGVDPDRVRTSQQLKADGVRPGYIEIDGGN